MKIRTKLMLSLSLLLIFIMLCLLAVTHIQFYIVRDLTYLKDKAVFESLTYEFEQYYKDHDQSWEGVQAWPFQHSRPFAEIALIIDGEALYKQGQLSVADLRADGYYLALYANDQRIGRMYVMNDDQYKTYEFKLMWYSLVPAVVKASLVITGMVALLMSLLLTWRLTSPIHRIIRGIEAIQSGKSDTSLPVRRKDEFGAISRALQKMNNSLESLEHSRKQLLSDVAHELKTPLMIIQGELELAQDTGAALTPEKQSSLLDEVYRLSRLVHDVLDLSRLEAGGTELRPRTENLVAIVESLMEKTEFLAEDKNIRCSLYKSEDVIEVSVEKHRVLQALYNMMVNAIHYTDEEGHVRIHMERAYKAEHQHEYVHITVEDNGIGIHEDDIPHIFSRFYRADHSRTRPSGGTGLGLAIAQQNILVHQGWIEVHSEIGKGTVFSVWLPTIPR